MRFPKGVSHRLILLPLALGCGIRSGGENEAFRKLTNIPYAEVGGHELSLDLYLPKDGEPSPLVVFVHGGGWRRGSKDSMPLTGLVHEGYAIASVDYRLSPVARFPAQVHDIKAAIRFLRADQSKYGYSAQRLAIAGASAGGHLAALVGVTNGHRELEGQVGDHVGQSSAVQAIVAFYGAGNFTTILNQSTPRGLSVRVPALELLLGGRPEDRADLANLASPVFHVDEMDPPLLLLHGDQDPQMPINQSHELHGKYKQYGLPVHFEVVNGAAHGGKQFYDGPRTRLVKEFLSTHIRAK